MKKVYLGLLTAFSLSNVTSTINAAIYLQNNYGAAIEYVQTTAEMVKLQPSSYPPMKLGNGARAEVGRTSPYLSVRSIGGSYSDVSHKLEEARREFRSHTGEDCLIVVYPRQGLSGIYNWNIQIEWEKPAATSSKKSSK